MIQDLMLKQLLAFFVNFVRLLQVNAYLSLYWSWSLWIAMLGLWLNRIMAKQKAFMNEVVSLSMLDDTVFSADKL